MEFLTENKSTKTNLIVIGIISSIIGGLIIYYLLKSRVTPAESFQAMNNLSLENRLINIEHRLQQLQIQPVSMQTLQPQQNINSVNNTNTYKNNEIRKYIRDAKGRITSTEIIRDAKIS